MIRTLASIVSAVAISLALPSISFATNISGGTNGASVGFVAPLRTLANAFEVLGAALVVIAIVVIMAQHMLHREDWGGLVRNLVFIIIGGSIVIAAGAFLNQVGVSTTASLLQ